MEQIPVLAVVGPTASGKTALAVELAILFGGEVISADSMQIYRGLPVGTAQPSEEEKKGVPHHLLAFLDWQEPFSVADYVQRAGACICEIHARGKLPVLAGGPGFIFLRCCTMYRLRGTPRIQSSAVLWNVAPRRKGRNRCCESSPCMIRKRLRVFPCVTASGSCVLWSSPL